MTIRLLSALIALLCISVGARAVPLRTEPLEIVSAGRVHRFVVEIADTDATREQGLMFRKQMLPDRGMLFDFGSPQAVTFWMKNTIIPLDMIFIAGDGHVLSIARNAAPESEALIPSGGPILGVLELRGGRAAELGIKPGDEVRERIFKR